MNWEGKSKLSVDIANSAHVVGMKQTLKALANDTALTVFIADDAHVYLKNKVLEAAKDSSAQIVYIETMKQLGSICRISRPASTAAIIKK